MATAAAAAVAARPATGSPDVVTDAYKHRDCCSGDRQIDGRVYDLASVEQSTGGGAVRSESVGGGRLGELDDGESCRRTRANGRTEYIG